MFDVGFGELLLIAVLGLLVLGPERLPVAIRTISLWVGRFKRSYKQIRTEVEREIGADEIRRQLQNEEIMQSLNAGQEELNATREEFNALVNKTTKDATSVAGITDNIADIATSSSTSTSSTSSTETSTSTTTVKSDD